MNNYKIALKKYFGYDDFRDKQLEIIKSMLEEKRDVLVIMFTGAGKSLCYQFPPVYTNKTTIVISPLIALMNDQQNKMNELKIPTCCLNSTVTNKMLLKKDILKNKYRLVYTTPEFIIKQQSFVEELVENDILLNFCVDEVHTVSQWGHDFREAYKKLNCLKEWAPNTPIAGFTATATKKVESDIISILGLNNVAIYKSTFDRSNLIIRLKRKTAHPMNDILPLLEKNKQTLIFCQTRNTTDEITKLLKQNNIKAEAYHAGMNSDEREEIHNKFANKEIICMCCTTAYGLGVSVTVDTVINYSIPANINEYVQQMGRIRNMDTPSNCYLLYDMSDMNTNNYFINQITNIQYRNNQIQLALVMKNYIFTSQCRRKYILDYFGEKYDKDNCGACDNCLNKKTLKTQNFAKEADLLFQTANLTGNAYGGMMLIQILRGANNKKILPANKKSKLYGAGKDKSEKYWKMVLMLLINDGYFKEKPISRGHGFTLAMTPKATKWMTDYKLDNKTVLNLVIPEDFDTVDKPKKVTVKNPVTKKPVQKKSILTLDESL